MLRRTLSLVLVAGFFAQPASAESERPDHYKGQRSETLEQAVKNFSEYNAKLEAVLAEEPLDLAKLNTIHQLTYTLENALEKIKSELDELSDTLEAVHKASEYGDADAVKAEGEKYLRVSRTLVD
ncbi:hypothetical protein OS187_11790 [Xanthomonadaceae bacterium JHOS43]|nr:hypothetical protein [Xanthomonadaceae bacterium JHOS43]